MIPKTESQSIAAMRETSAGNLITEGTCKIRVYEDENSLFEVGKSYNFIQSDEPVTSLRFPTESDADIFAETVQKDTNLEDKIAVYFLNEEDGERGYESEVITTESFISNFEDLTDDEDILAVSAGFDEDEHTYSLFFGDENSEHTVSESETNLGIYGDVEENISSVSTYLEKMTGLENSSKLLQEAFEDMTNSYEDIKMRQHIEVGDSVIPFQSHITCL